MNNEMCFKIDSKELFLEQVLVEYHKTPVYFVCKDNNEVYYVVLCVDIDDEKYIVVETEIERLVNLFRKKITMRDIILTELKYWEIIAGDNLSDDICTQLDIEQINMDDLPYNNSYFIVLSKEHQEYFEYLKDVIMSNDTEWEILEAPNKVINELDIQISYDRTNISEYVEIKNLKTDVIKSIMVNAILECNEQISDSKYYEGRNGTTILENNHLIAT
ncbi:MAG: hypothetical protein R3Y67_06795 [Eubacteriales bacterium]